MEKKTPKARAKECAGKIQIFPFFHLPIHKRTPILLLLLLLSANLILRFLPKYPFRPESRKLRLAKKKIKDRQWLKVFSYNSSLALSVPDAATLLMLLEISSTPLLAAFKASLAPSGNCANLAFALSTIAASRLDALSMAPC